MKTKYTYLIIHILSKTLLVVFIIANLNQDVEAQISQSFQSQRAKEDYSFLKDSTDLKWYDAMKYIGIGESRNAYLSIGGSVRPRIENFVNQNWIPADNPIYYSQRIAVHTDWHLGQQFRVFAELQHGLTTEGNVFLQDDILDVNQAFVEYKTADSKLTLRVGRQEMQLGAGRLIDYSAGPNLRAVFDQVTIDYKLDKVNLRAFFGQSVSLQFDAFDNRSYIFDEVQSSPQLWGIYTTLPGLFGDTNSNTEVYYLGYSSANSAYSDVIGSETRHTIGTRLYGTVGAKFSYNTELIYQFGDIAGSSISAYNFEADWNYRLADKHWTPTLGLKLDFSSGDRSLADDKINTFNPLFVNAAIYGFAILNTPANLHSIHPSIAFFPSKKTMINIEYVLYYRNANVDGVYSPIVRQTVPHNIGVSDKHIGNSIGILFNYDYDRNFNLQIVTSYFINGAYLSSSGDYENAFHFSPTLKFAF